MKPLLRMPGNRCAHYGGGRCLREEHLNPGYHAGHICRVLARFCQAYDGFLNQADAFGLEETSAWSIWRKRFEVLATQETGCQDHKPGDSNEFPWCSHARGDVCLLALPVCRGQCVDYRLHHNRQRG